MRIYSLSLWRMAASKLGTYLGTLLFFCAVTNGQSFWDELNNIADSAKQYLNGFVEGADYLLTTVKAAQQYLDDAIDEDCEYSCPRGLKKKKNPNYLAVPNGCGTTGYQISEEQLPVAALSNCCNLHDVCYGTCNKDKDECDKEFKKCLYSICDKTKPRKMDQDYLRNCKTSAKILYTGTVALGCRPYKDAQASACLCVIPPHKHHMEL